MPLDKKRENNHIEQFSILTVIVGICMHVTSFLWCSIHVMWHGVPFRILQRILVGLSYSALLDMGHKSAIFFRIPLALV